MTASITLQNVSYKTNDGNVILRDVSVSFPFHRTGLIGDNGSGKTTALRLLAGEITPTSGQVIRSADAKILHLPQDYRLDTTATVTDTLGIDPSEIDSRAVWALVQVGLGDIELNRTIGTLSGGERMRVLLAKALMIEPDFLLLDEPTNNLDSESRTFVMDLIREWKRGLIVVSHDRELLDCVDGIVEMSALGAKSYGGNFELYRAQKSNESGAAARKVTEAKKELAGIKRRAQEKMESQEKRMRRGEKRRDSIGAGKAQMDFFANRAEATSGRNKKLFDDRLSQATNSLEEAKKSILPENRIVVDLGGTCVPSGKLVAAFHDMTFAYSPTENVIENFSLEIFGPERIAITGPNGSGKTTLVRLLTGELQPTSGEVKLGVASWAYLDQHVRLLPQDKTLAQSVAERLGSDETTARDWLGRFLFSQEAAKKLGRDLSGGERMRAALAYVLAGDAPPQLLILDEPTNNLDIRTTEQIESALQNFEGTIIVISHDQEFLHRIGVTKTIAI